MPAKILVADDEPNIVKLLRLYLREEGYEIVAARNGREALERFRAESPDLVLLDLMMPELGGFEVCTEIRRESDVPVIMLTARDGELEKVRGLKAGADDYVTKPFGRQELLARVEALLRRGAEPVVVDDYEAGVVSIDVAQRRVLVHGEEVQLTPLEFKLLSALVRNSTQVLGHEQLLEQVWGHDYFGDSKTVDVHIRWLREKLEANPSAPEHLVTVRGFGYRFG